MAIDFYQKMHDMLQEERRFVLMVVVANEGSSPGRKGFKMAVSKTYMFGTIGGGIMEHKLVEFARSLLHKPSFEPFLKHQIHDKSAPSNQSGMICSGHQTIAFYDVDEKYGTLLNSIANKEIPMIHFSEEGIGAVKETKPHEWHYAEPLSSQNKVYVIGGGHVGLALCEVLSRLDFEIHILDHRENLNTMAANVFAHHHSIVEFEKIEQHVPEDENTYVVIMSFGYRTDEVIIRQLLGRKYKYIGLMGSKEKIATLFKNLVADGFSQKDIDFVHAPIGIDIKSETTQEIAISVAAELIKTKNKG